MPPTNPKGPLLSKRQHRMLQDMGIDVFFSRQAVSDIQTQLASQPPVQSQPPGYSQSTGQAQARPAATAETGAQQPSPASAARAALAQSAPTPNQQTEAMSGAGPNPSSIETVSGTNAAQVETGLTIELSFVATPSLVWVGAAFGGWCAGGAKVVFRFPLSFWYFLKGTAFFVGYGPKNAASGVGARNRRKVM